MRDESLPEEGELAFHQVACAVQISHRSGKGRSSSSIGCSPSDEQPVLPFENPFFDREEGFCQMVMHPLAANGGALIVGHGIETHHAIFGTAVAQAMQESTAVHPTGQVQIGE